ncbi:MAG: hypothetical protein J5939_08345 [Bacteroidales bacterium]|nr:hypothetical protein [Bacteroidales bacterium]
MKKSLYLGLAALAALSLASCQKETGINAPEKNLVTVTLTAQKAGDETKTSVVVGDKASYYWTEEDQANLKLFQVTTTTEGDKVTETLTEIADRTVSISADNKVLTITATVEENATLRAAVAGAWTGNEGATNRKPKVNPSQAPAADSFDPNADVLVAEDVTVSEAENLAVTFGRKAVVAMMTLKNLVEGETVSKVTISSTTNVTGYYDYSKGSMTGQNKEIVLTYDNAVVGSDGEFPVYFVAMPNEGVELTVVAKTDQYTYSKTFGPVKFTTGKFTKFGVNMEGCGEEVVDTDFTGDWVITGTSDGITYAMKAYAGGNNTAAIPVKFDAEKEEIATTEVDAIKMHFEKVSEGEYAGMYTISDSKGNYFYAASSSGNHLKAANPATKTADYYWAVSAESDGTYSIVAEKSTNRNVMRFNIGSVIFSCYTGGQLALTLYPYSWVVEDEQTIEPSGDGTLASPYNVAAAIEFTESLGTATSDDYIYIIGTISQIPDKGTYGSYGNATFYISDDGLATSPQFEAYRILYLGNVAWTTGQTNIAVGDEVILCGKVKMYNGTPEISQDGYLYSLNGVTDGNTGEEVTGTISFGLNDTKINAASVTGTDDLGNTWTVTTEGTTSFTANAAYYQVGSGSKPATSITFSTTLPNDAEITAFSAKFGGFSNTAGDVLLEVGETEVGSGSLDGINDVTIEASETATGKVLTVSVTNINRGVKVYNITYSYK